MRIIVVGLGSMGNRRIRLLRRFFSDVTIAGIDERLDRRLEASEKYRIETYSLLDEAIEKESPHAAFICTSPIHHHELVIKCLNSDIHVFSELNLINEDHIKILELLRQKNLKFFLSSTMLYRKEIQLINKKINGLNVEKYQYRYHVGQYLPDWHPWENYRDYFVSNKNTNSCREILAIELPWIINTFGDIENIIVRTDTLTKLDVDYPDSYIIILEHKTGHKGILQINVVSRRPVRNLEIISENIYLEWNGKPDGLYEFSLTKKEMVSVETYTTIDKDARYADYIIEDAYLEEIKIFMNMLNGITSDNLYNLKDEINILKLIDKIEGC